MDAETAHHALNLRTAVVLLHQARQAAAARKGISLETPESSHARRAAEKLKYKKEILKQKFQSENYESDSNSEISLDNSSLQLTSPFSEISHNRTILPGKDKLAQSQGKLDFSTMTYIEPEYQLTIEYITLNNDIAQKPGLVVLPSSFYMHPQNELNHMSGMNNHRRKREFNNAKLISLNKDEKVSTKKQVQYNTNESMIFQYNSENVINFLLVEDQSSCPSSPHTNILNHAKHIKSALTKNHFDGHTLSHMLHHHKNHTSKCNNLPEQTFADNVSSKNSSDMKSVQYRNTQYNSSLTEYIEKSRDSSTNNFFDKEFGYMADTGTKRQKFKRLLHRTTDENSKQSITNKSTAPTLTYRTQDNLYSTTDMYSSDSPYLEKTRTNVIPRPSNKKEMSSSKQLTPRLSEYPQHLKTANQFNLQNNFKDEKVSKKKIFSYRTERDLLPSNMGTTVETFTTEYYQQPIRSNGSHSYHANSPNTSNIGQINESRDNTLKHIFNCPSRTTSNFDFLSDNKSNEDLLVPYMSDSYKMNSTTKLSPSCIIPRFNFNSYPSQSLEGDSFSTRKSMNSYVFINDNKNSPYIPDSTTTKLVNKKPDFRFEKQVKASGAVGLVSLLPLMLSRQEVWGTPLRCYCPILLQGNEVGGVVYNIKPSTNLACEILWFWIQAIEKGINEAEFAAQWNSFYSPYYCKKFADYLKIIASMVEGEIRCNGDRKSLLQGLLGHLAISVHMALNCTLSLVSPIEVGSDECLITYDNNKDGLPDDHSNSISTVFSHSLENISSLKEDYQKIFSRLRLNKRKLALHSSTDDGSINSSIDQARYTSKIEITAPKLIRIPKKISKIYKVDPQKFINELTSPMDKITEFESTSLISSLPTVHQEYYLQPPLQVTCASSKLLISI